MTMEKERDQWVAFDLHHDDRNMRSSHDGAMGQASYEQIPPYFLHPSIGGRIEISRLRDSLRDTPSEPIRTGYHWMACEDQLHVADRFQLLDLDWRRNQIVEQLHRRYSGFQPCGVSILPSFWRESVEEGVSRQIAPDASDELN
jgi:hypothetical protein